jgi:hypothetical protein
MEQGLRMLSSVTAWLEAHAAQIPAQIRMVELFSSTAIALRERHSVLLQAARARFPADFDTRNLLVASSVLGKLTGREDDDTVLHLLALECLVRCFYVSEQTYTNHATSYRRMAAILGPFCRRHSIPTGLRQALSPIIEDLRDVGLADIADELSGGPIG